MRVISPSELNNNLQKYLDLAKSEKVVIRRNKNETFILSEEVRLSPNDDLARAITAEELLVGVEEDIRRKFRERNSKK